MNLTKGKRVHFDVMFLKINQVNIIVTLIYFSFSQSIIEDANSPFLILVDFKAKTFDIERFSETNLIGTILVLHWVGIEDANHCPSVSLPQICVNRPEQEERHIHFQIMKIIQLPDAEGFPLQNKNKHVDDYTIFHIQNIRNDGPLRCFCSVG